MALLRFLGLRARVVDFAARDPNLDPERQGRKRSREDETVDKVAGSNNPAEALQSW